MYVKKIKSTKCFRENFHLLTPNENYKLITMSEMIPNV